MITAEEKQEIKNKAAKPMLWLAIVSMCMIFGSLTSAYMVRRGDPGWLTFDLPQLFYVSTALIIASSFSMLFAFQSARKDNFSGIKFGLVITLILGIAFAICQYLGWNEVFAKGIPMTGPGSNPSASFLFLIPLVHLVHVAAGIVVLIYVCIKSFKEIYHSKNLLGLQLCSIFWHFLDLLWVYLFLFLYFTH